MTTPELHTEDLLDREARGALTAEERVRLESHLAACAVCRFERDVRADFREEFESLRGSASAERERERKSLRGAPESLRALPPRPAPGRWRLVGFMAAALLLAGVAGAEWARSRQALFAPPVPSAREVEAVSPAAAKKQRHRAPVALSASAAAEPELVESATAEAAPAPSASALSAPPSERSEPHAGSTRQHPAPDLAQPAPASSVAPVVTESATALFAEASTARERGDYDEAVRQYDDLIGHYPSSAQALTARAILGRLLLDRGDPTGATALFDAYLMSGETALREEALLGRALAFGKLASHTQEANAWRELLQAYPSSVHAARAKARLATLEMQ